MASQEAGRETSSMVKVLYQLPRVISAELLISKIEEMTQPKCDFKEVEWVLRVPQNRLPRKCEWVPVSFAVEISKGKALATFDFRTDDLGVGALWLELEGHNGQLAQSDMDLLEEFALAIEKAIG